CADIIQISYQAIFLPTQAGHSQILTNTKINKMSEKNDNLSWFGDAWAFATISILSSIVMIAFGVGFLILPQFQERRGRSTTSDAIHSALGFHKGEKSISNLQRSPKIPTNIIWNESTVHQTLSGDTK